MKLACLNRTTGGAMPAGSPCLRPLASFDRAPCVSLTAVTCGLFDAHDHGRFAAFRLASPQGQKVRGIVGNLFEHDRRAIAVMRQPGLSASSRRLVRPRLRIRYSRLFVDAAAGVGGKPAMRQ
jgi:hypothetical protein